jgi:hypothetical protein
VWGFMGVVVCGVMGGCGGVWVDGCGGVGLYGVWWEFPHAFEHSKVCTL